MKIVAKKISKEGISKEFEVENAVQFDKFLGRKPGYTNSAYSHGRFTKAVDGTCYAITYFGDKRIITDQQIDCYYRDNFDATYKTQWTKKELDRRKNKHERIRSVLLKINSKYKYLTQAEGTTEFEELQKLLGV